MRLQEKGREIQLKKPRVAVVEDDAGIRETLQTLLKGDYELLMVSRGDVAEAAIRGFDPAAVILDIHLPGMNGFEVCERIRAISSLRGLPIIFLTSKQDAWTKMTTKDVGGDYYLPKPFAKDELLKTIREAVSGG
ncbi:MAG: response regulator [Elusimicrobia bacterium]|nr:response regulator [Elusimicrobiota bacterium]